MRCRLSRWPYCGEESGYLAGITGGAALPALLGLALTYRRPQWTFAVLWGTIALGIPFLVHGLATWGLTLSDRLIVEHYLGSAEVARYYVAFVIGTAIFIALDAANSAWVPQSIPVFPPGPTIDDSWVFGVSSHCRGGVACAFFVAAVAPLLVRVLAPHYGSSLAIVGLIAASTCTRVVDFLCVVVTTQAKDSVSSAVSSVLATATLIAVYVFFVGRLGITAAAVGVFRLPSRGSGGRHARARGPARQAASCSSSFCCPCGWRLEQR